jgi:hypothetical protein
MLLSDRGPRPWLPTCKPKSTQIERAETPDVPRTLLDSPPAHLGYEDSLEESFSSAEFAIGLAAEAQAEEALGEGSGELVGSGEFR